MNDKFLNLFSEVVKCDLCTELCCPKVVRDNNLNIPQPGYIGENYTSARVLLVGQNPGNTIQSTEHSDKEYMEKLKKFKASATRKEFEALRSTLSKTIPTWPVHNQYFPLFECKLSLKDIAYCNVVRCRTKNNSKPTKRQINNCRKHFETWIIDLEPTVVVFVGKWASDTYSSYLTQHRIKNGFINRMRSLSKKQRQENRDQIVTLVKSCLPSFKV